MPDLESILARLEALDRYISELDFYAQYSADEIVNDFVKYRAVQHSLQLAAQTVADIAAHIITADFQTRARDYRMGTIGCAGFARKDAHQLLGPNLQPRFLAYFADGGINGSFIGLHPAAGQTPAAAVGPFH